ncbi:nad dependent epimerase dehydratase family protein [Diaporthe amygdali]|uniref:nad dependent epimerase dehydratase family protein n=1 Tax=Phomopsis amygdali TaxID=1214568 RepID=UPI0022FE7B3C|nr:nad dependent epimerase dehydratase family protein [Diaporthe amygdali]KAJ0124587.1 nad dependent epimerase dehydratase family protein [Diaporthe amygdali]
MPSTAQKTLFLVGPGLIGGSLLVKLKEVRPDLKLHALTRRDDQAAELKEQGIEPVRGSLEDADIIKEWAAKSDIIIHTASADDDKGAFAIVEGLKSRDKNSKRAIYIQTSGNDELANSAKGLGTKSIEEKTLSDLNLTDEDLDARIAPDAYHRHVDGHLRKEILNPEKEKEHNVVSSLMMPPLIYGIGSAPWHRISIQTPMLTSFMIKNGLVTLPEGFTGAWNCVWVHDLVDQYILLLQHLEKLEPGQQKTHYVFPAEKKPFLWKEHFDAIAAELKRLDHPVTKSNGGKPRELKTKEEFIEFVGGKDNPYSECFGYIVWGTENSYTSPDLTTSLGFKHKAKGVVDSILNGKELEKFIKEQKN